MYRLMTPLTTMLVALVGMLSMSAPLRLALAPATARHRRGASMVEYILLAAFGTGIIILMYTIVWPRIQPILNDIANNLTTDGSGG